MLKLRPVPPLLFKLVLFKELQQNIFNEGIYEENLVPLRIKLYYYSHSTLNKFTPAIYFKEHVISTHKKKMQRNSHQHLFLSQNVIQIILLQRQKLHCLPMVLHTQWH